jgi:hypothetical protein
MPTAVKAPEENDLECRAEDREENRRHQQRKPEITGGNHYPVRDVCADHVEGPVREVEHVHQAEDDRQAGSQQENKSAEGQPVDD